MSRIGSTLLGPHFLGLTMECTRCHDHKYDPVTQKDYFSLSAFFNNIDEAGLYSFFTGSVPTPTLELGDLPSDNKIRDAEKKLENILSSEDARPAFADWKKQVKFEKMGNATFFSKIIPPLAKAETSLDILSLKPSLWLDASEQKQKQLTGWIKWKPQPWKEAWFPEITTSSIQRIAEPKIYF